MVVGNQVHFFVDFKFILNIDFGSYPSFWIVKMSPAELPFLTCVQSSGLRLAVFDSSAELFSLSLVQSSGLRLAVFDFSGIKSPNNLNCDMSKFWSFLFFVLGLFRQTKNVTNANQFTVKLKCLILQVLESKQFVTSWVCSDKQRMLQKRTSLQLNWNVGFIILILWSTLLECSLALTF